MTTAATPLGANRPLTGRQGSSARGGAPDRAIEFRRAMRHSALVKTLKALLPLMAAGILSLYALPSLLSVPVDKGRGTATVRAVALEAGALKMLEPRVRGVNERNEAYEIVADSATQASRTAETMVLENIRGRIGSHNGAVTTMIAPDGVHNSKAEEMSFSNGVVIRREPDFSATFKTATAYMKKQMVISHTPVVVRLHESTIEADGMTLFWGEQRAIFEGNVRTHIERQASEADARKEPAPRLLIDPAGAVHQSAE
jgi:lipopolysaccharide export system protein LptC